MKTKLVYLILILVCSACGTKKSDDSVTAASSVGIPNKLINTWIHTDNGDHLVIESGGTFTSSYCGEVGSISNVTSNSASIVISQSNNAMGCLPSGTYACSYLEGTPSGVSTLVVDCGYGAVTYTQASQTCVMNIYSQLVNAVTGLPCN